MPALGYKKWKADKVESRKSRQTIRPERKNPIKPGDKLYHFRDFRTKNVKRLEPEGCLYDEKGRAYDICKSVQQIIITRNVMYAVAERGRYLEPLKDITIQFVKEDGFDTINEFYNFFKNNYGLPFEGVLIKW